MTFDIEIDNSSERILRFLKSSDEAFCPPLSSRLDLQVYSRKLGVNAINYFVVSDEIDIGHAGFYLDEELFKKAFISSIATLPGFEKKGIGHALLSEVICHCIKSSMDSLSLQVHPDNAIARNLYRKFGFKDDQSGINLMTLKISDLPKLDFNLESRKLLGFNLE